VVTQSRSVEQLLLRVHELGIPAELARTIQERSHRHAEAMNIAPEVAEARFFGAAIAARNAGGETNLVTAEAILRQIGLRSSDVNPEVNVVAGTRVGIFGWGLIGPGVANIDQFREKIRDGGSWLEPFNGFGRDNFLVGNPSFDFTNYRSWIEERFEANRFTQIEKKLGNNTKFAVGAFIQALGQNPGIEQTLADFRLDTHIYVGTGVGDIPTMYQINLSYYKAQRRWNRFWGTPARCAALREYLDLPSDQRALQRERNGVPPEPDEVLRAAQADADAAEATAKAGTGAGTRQPHPPTREELQIGETYEAAREAWESYWAARSDLLAEYLRESARLHDVEIRGDIEKDKVRVIKKRLVEMKKLNQKWQIPPEPWASVSANRIWNIDNVPAAQIAMLGRIHGPSFAPIGACSGFDIALDLGVQAIRDNRAKAVIVGMTDPPPHPLLVGAFYDARVISCDAKTSKPLGGLKGTHVSGGALIWILGDLDAMLDRGHRPLGCEILGTGTSSDAYHIITPSKTGPRLAILDALKDAQVSPEEIDTWDLHATATPGDWMEVQNTTEILGRSPVFTAQKGVFGHGMSVGGGWELTAQHLAMEEGQLHPTGIPSAEINPEISELCDNVVIDQPRPFTGKIGGKINMGIGGVNGVVISRVWDFDPTIQQIAAVLGCEVAELRARIERGEIERYVDEHGIERVPHAEYRRLTDEPSGG
jgi:hypothetical protein